MQDSLSFRVVFDVTASSYNMWREAVPPALMAGAIALFGVLGPRASSLRVRTAALRGRFIVFSASIVMFALSVSLLVETRGDFDRLRGALEAEAVESVEGVVVDFVPEGKDGHPRESFSVAGRRIAYSSSDLSSGYHLTASRGGLIHEGVRVQVVLVGEEIVRLSVAP